jgi:hypothetical protein
MFDHNGDTVHETWINGFTSTCIPNDWMTATPDSSPSWSEGQKAKPISKLLTEEEFDKLWKIDVEVCGECSDNGTIFIVLGDYPEL